LQTSVSIVCGAAVSSLFCVSAFIAMKKKKQPQPPSPLAKELTAIILFTVGLGIGLSLVSYHAGDPSFSLYTSESRHIKNFLGVVGSYTADLLLQAIGWASFFLVAILFILSFRLFLSLRWPVSRISGISAIGLIISAVGLLSLSIGPISVERWGNYSGNAGGLAGYFLITFSTRYLNTIGSYIVLVLVLVLSLMGTIGFSLRRACSRAAGVVKKTALRLAGFIKHAYARLRAWSAFRKKKQARETATNGTGSKPKEVKQSRETPKPEPFITTSPAMERSVAEDISRAAARPQRVVADFELPTLDLLNEPEKKTGRLEREQLLENSQLLEKKLADFGVQASVVNVHPGPLVTMYELEPAPGVKINRIVNLADDLALALRAEGIRIVAPIPGKGAIGVEIPNHQREVVFFRDIVSQESFFKSNAPLTVGMGKDISGMPIIADLATMPHLLIAGTTGSGKSVFINTMICSLLYKSPPSEVKLLVVDPKRSELTFYEDIPHLLYPVVTDAKEASEVLRWAVEEMDRRYHLLATLGARDIYSFNKKVENQAKKTKAPPVPPPDGEGTQDDALHPMPWIVIIIDELANLMMVASREVEWALARLAQMARAAGIHLLVATQRPSVDVITGTIKANFPARISFRLTSKTDSRIILDGNGAESLLNQGDMLFMSPRTPRLKRIHGPYISDDEIRRIVDFLKAQAQPEYQELKLNVPDDTEEESPVWSRPPFLLSSENCGLDTIGQPALSSKWKKTESSAPATA